MKTVHALAASAAVMFLLSPVAGRSQTTAAPDPVRLQLARQIFESQGGMQTVQATMKSMENSMLSGSTPEVKQRMTDAMDGMVNALIPKLFDEMAGFYATDFSEDELKGILAFYQSPTGQALKEKAPLVAQQIGLTMVKLIPRMQLSVLEKVCATTECTAQQQQQLAALKQSVPPDQRL